MQRRVDGEMMDDDDGEEEDDQGEQQMMGDVEGEDDMIDFDEEQLQQLLMQH